jgi:NAD(P)-dependent dehydrogenase (short-subunit alcohol dehydrogenase family)
MAVIAVTGAASGIGAGIRARLERDGARVIGVDLRAAEVIADLSTAAGRAAALTAIEAAAPAGLDGLVACAGLGPHVADLAAIASVNYFGAQVLLDGLRPLLARAAQPSAVAISSNSTTMPGAESPLVDLCLAGDEAGVRELATTLAGHQVYAGSKLALTRWLRRTAPRPEWAGANIRLNAVAAGPVQTPLLQGGLDHPVFGPAIRNFPVPCGGPGTPADVAAAVAFLLGGEARYVCGSVLFVDGGTDALVRGDQY